jgi:hypothetical protein
MAVFKGNLFVTQYGTPGNRNTGSIGVYNATSGAPVNPSLVSGVNFPWAIAVGSVPAPAAVLQITSITHPASNTIHLSGIGAPNAVNRIESSTNPNPSSFTTLHSVTTDATGAVAYDDTSAGTKKFYRLAYP